MPHHNFKGCNRLFRSHVSQGIPAGRQPCLRNGLLAQQRTRAERVGCLIRQFCMGFSWTLSAHPQSMPGNGTPASYLTGTFGPGTATGTGSPRQALLRVHAKIVSTCTVARSFDPLPSIICTQGVSWRAAINSDAGEDLPDPGSCFLRPACKYRPVETDQRPTPARGVLR